MLGGPGSWVADRVGIDDCPIASIDGLGIGPLLESGSALAYQSQNDQPFPRLLTAG